MYEYLAQRKFNGHLEGPPTAESAPPTLQEVHK